MPMFSLYISFRSRSSCLTVSIVSVSVVTSFQFLLQAAYVSVK